MTFFSSHFTDCVLICCSAYVYVVISLDDIYCIFMIHVFLVFVVGGYSRLGSE